MIMMEDEKKTKAQLLTELEAVQSKYELKEAALRECEEKYRIVVENTNDSIVVMDWNGRYLSMNSVSAQILGGQIEDFIGQSLHDTLPRETADKHLKSIREVISSGRGHTVENAMQIKDKVRWFQASTQPVKVFSGNVFAVAVISRDITERKRAETKLIESESMLREKTLALEQKNIALREMINQIEIEKRRVQNDVVTNVDIVISPILEKLKTEKTVLKYVNLLQYYFERLTYSYGNNIVKKSLKLTTREIEICHMVKGGLTSKDIANLLNISSKTVEKHRNSIRNKLGISRKNINLTSFLRQL